METARATQEEPRDVGPQRTLGDVLYAGIRRPPVPERAWADLVRAVAAGDQTALRTLYEQAHRLVFTLALRIVRSRQTAEEIVVDVFHDVWRRAPAYDPAAGPVLGWVMNQTRSRAIDRVRFEQRKKRNGPGAGSEPAPPGQRPDESFEREQQGRLVRDALAVLTPAERTAIETAFLSELTYHEVAVRLNEPLGTIKTRVRSGLGKLRRALAHAAAESP
jgi:RNA polymerase sigma-70 factor, ECF subfamily